MNFPDSIPANEVARLMAQHGITRAVRDPVAASRYRLCQQGTEIFFEHLEQFSPVGDKGTKSRVRREATDE